jgi:ATP-dependent RNA helicase SUPV3L1/SUV3
MDIATAEDSKGVVTCLRPEHLPTVRRALSKPITPIRRAALKIPYDRIAKVAALLPVLKDFSDLIRAILLYAKTSPDYYITNGDRIGPTGPLLSKLDGLTLGEKAQFVDAPVSTRIPEVVEAFMEFAKTQADGKCLAIEDWAKQVGLMEVLERIEGGDPATLKRENFFSLTLLLELEARHRCIVLYLWLSYRFPLAFPSHVDGLAIKKRVEEALQLTLEHTSHVRAKTPGSFARATIPEFRRETRGVGGAAAVQV